VTEDFAVTIACALGHKACRDNRSVLYQRVPKLFADLALARGDGRYARIMLSRDDLDERAATIRMRIRRRGAAMIARERLSRKRILGVD
jgi:IstB-like ATP binding protein